MPKEKIRLLKETADSALNSLIPGFSDLPNTLEEAIHGLLDFAAALGDVEDAAGGAIGGIGGPGFVGNIDPASPGAGAAGGNLGEGIDFETMGEGIRELGNMFGGLVGTFKEMDGEGDAVAKSAGEASTALGIVSLSFQHTIDNIDRMVNELAEANSGLDAFDLQKIKDAIISVTAQLETSLGENILQYIENGEIRRRVEQANHQLRILELRAQFEALKALGVLSEAVLNIYANAIEQIENTPFNAPVFTGGSGGSSGGNSGVQAREARRAEIRKMFEDMQLAASGISDAALAVREFQAESNALAEEMRSLSVFSEEFISEFIALREELERGDILAPFRTIIEQQGMTDLQLEIQQIQDQANAAREALILLGASEEELAVITEAVQIQMDALIATFHEAETSFTQAQQNRMFSVAGVQDFAGELASLHEEFAALVADAEALGQSTDSLTEALNQGETAISFGFLQSLQSLGVEIPGLGIALVELQRTMVLAQLASLSSSDVFMQMLEDMGTTFDELVAGINEVFDGIADGLNDVDDARPPWLEAIPPSGNTDAPEPPWMQIIRDIEAYEQAASELGLSSLEKELRGIQNEFEELYQAAEDANLGASYLNRITEAYQLFLEDFWERAYEPVRDALLDLQQNDPSRSDLQVFEDLKSRFLDAVSRAQGGDLEAIQEAASLGLQLRDVGANFFGTATGSFQSLMDMIQQQLQSILPEGMGAESLDADMERNNILVDIRSILSTGLNVNYSNSPDAEERENRKMQNMEAQTFELRAMREEIRNLREENRQLASKLDTLAGSR